MTTVISDLPGFVPFGPVYADHWAENVSPAATDMSAAIQSAADYCAPLAVPVFLADGKYYKCASALIFNKANTHIRSDGQGNTRATLYYTGTASVDFITIGPTNATTPATATLSNLSLIHI